MISHEVTGWLLKTLDMHYPPEKKAKYNEEKRIDEVKQFLNLVKTARREFLRLIPSDDAQFDTEYYDVEKSVAGDDLLKYVATRGKIGDVEIDELLMGNTTAFRHLSNESQNVQNLIVTGVEILKWASESLKLLKPYELLRVENLQHCIRKVDTILRKQNQFNRLTKKWKVLKDLDNPFKKVLKKADKYKKSIRNLNANMERWFKEWDEWHIAKKIDIRGQSKNSEEMQESSEKQQVVSPGETVVVGEKAGSNGQNNTEPHATSATAAVTTSTTMNNANGTGNALMITSTSPEQISIATTPVIPQFPPPYPGKLSTVENVLSNRRYVPVILEEFERLQKNFVQLKQYLALDKETYKRPPKKRKAKKSEKDGDSKKKQKLDTTKIETLSNSDSGTNMSMKRKRDDDGEKKKKDGRGRPRKNSVVGNPGVNKKNPVGRPRKNSVNDDKPVKKNPVGRPRKNSVVVQKSTKKDNTTVNANVWVPVANVRVPVVQVANGDSE